MTTVQATAAVKGCKLPNTFNPYEDSVIFTSEGRRMKGRSIGSERLEQIIRNYARFYFHPSAAEGAGGAQTKDAIIQTVIVVMKAFRPFGTFIVCDSSGCWEATEGTVRKDIEGIFLQHAGTVPPIPNTVTTSGISHRLSVDSSQAAAESAQITTSLVGAVQPVPANSLFLKSRWTRSMMLGIPPDEAVKEEDNEGDRLNAEQVDKEDSDIVEDEPSMASSSALRNQIKLEDLVPDSTPTGAPKTKRILPEEFVPPAGTVVIAKGHAKNLPGNRKLLELTRRYLHEYSKKTATRQQRASIIRDIMVRMYKQCPTGAFVKVEGGRYWEADEHTAREKISQMFRNLLVGSYKSSSKYKSALRRDRKKMTKIAENLPTIKTPSQSCSNVNDPTPKASAGSTSGFPASNSSSISRSDNNSVVHEWGKSIDAVAVRTSSRIADTHHTTSTQGTKFRLAAGYDPNLLMYHKTAAHRPNFGHEGFAIDGQRSVPERFA